METKGSLIRTAIKTISVAVFAMALFFTSTPAWAFYWADNFDDNLIDPNWAYDANNHSEVKLYEASARLNFTASSAAYYDYALYYVSNLQINFMNDFDITVQGYDAYTGANRAALEFGLFNYGGATTSTVYAYESLSNLGADKMLDSGIRGSAITPVINSANRDAANGWGKIWYESSADTLQMGFYDGDPNGGGTLLNSSIYNNFNALYSPGAMRVYLAGLTYVAPVGDGQMYYDNFSVNVNAPPVPEPASLLLFGVAGLVIVFLKRKKTARGV